MRDIASVVGLKVIASKEGRDLGPVNQVIVDLASGEVQGLIIGSAPSEKGVPAEDITIIGSDAVMVETHKVAKHLSELPELMEKRRDPREGPREVLTDGGRRMGVLGAIYVDPFTKKVTRYEISGGAWRDITEGVVSLTPAPGTVDGRDTVVIPDDVVSSVTENTGGLRAQLARLREVARTQAQQANEKLEQGVDGVKRSVSAAGEKAKEAAQELHQAETGNAVDLAEGEPDPSEKTEI